jgi:hypothetical protein
MCVNYYNTAEKLSKMFTPVRKHGIREFRETP